MSDADVELPRARPWSEPITIEQYIRFTPEKLELVSGYLIDGPEASNAREELLALLLANVGLVTAVTLAAREEWIEALESSYIEGVSRE